MFTSNGQSCGMVTNIIWLQKFDCILTTERDLVWIAILCWKFHLKKYWLFPTSSERDFCASQYSTSTSKYFTFNHLQSRWRWIAKELIRWPYQYWCNHIHIRVVMNAGNGWTVLESGPVHRRDYRTPRSQPHGHLARHGMQQHPTKIYLRINK